MSHFGRRRRRARRRFGAELAGRLAALHAANPASNGHASTNGHTLTNGDAPANGNGVSNGKSHVAEPIPPRVLPFEISSEPEMTPSAVAAPSIDTPLLALDTPVQ